ncbi:hypothetical protein ACT6QH_01880 [Xanthobacter sp. TB0139]|uniref:hypothetical protein n=1 Tax=Xanthobacter sp. TB0139 TaxID=3459178 RepID=UPI004039BDDE
MMQLILSFVPWWLYASASVGIYVAARRWLGEVPATVYALVAVAWVAMDYGGDTREAWVRERGQQAIAKADAAIASAAESRAAALQEKLDQQARELKEATDALETLSGQPGCTAGDVLERLPGWHHRH